VLKAPHFRYANCFLNEQEVDVMKSSLFAFVFSLMVGSLAEAALTEDAFRQECQNYLTSDKASAWARDEAAWMGGLFPRELMISGTEKNLTALQKAVFGMDPRLSIAPGELQIRISATPTNIHFLSFIGEKEVGAVDFDWKSVRFGFLDQSSMSVDGINSKYVSVEQEIRANLHFLLMRKVSNTTIGLVFRTRSNSYFQHMGDPATGRGQVFGLYVVRKCKGILGAERDFLFPAVGSDPQAKNLCLAPIGFLEDRS
jgi:hypothetical protein